MRKTSTTFWGMWVVLAGIPLWSFWSQNPLSSRQITADDALVTLPVCADSLFYTYTFQIEDPEPPVDPADLEFDGGRSGLTVTDIQIQPGGHTAVVQATGQIGPGNFTLTIRYDADTSRVHLRVTSQPDTEAPVLVYPAAGLLAQISSCEGNRAVFSFTVSATDNCDPAPAVIASVVQGTANLIPILPGGQYLLLASPGEHDILLTTADAAGNVRQENVPVRVELTDVPPPNLGCNDTVRVAQDADCRRLLSPDLLLEGAFGCLQPFDFDIQLADEDPSNGPVLDGTGSFSYRIAGLPPRAIRGLNGPLDTARWVRTAQGNARAELDTSGIRLEVPYAAGSGQVLHWKVPRAGTLRLDWALQDDAADALLSVERATPQNQRTDLLQDSTASGSLSLDLLEGEVLILRLEAADDRNGAASAVLSNWSYRPDALPGFEACEGTLLAEDQIPPQLHCPPDTENGIRIDTVQNLSGAISDTDPTFVPANANCLAAAGPGNYSFDTLSFQVDAGGTYLLELSAEWGPGRAALLRGGFYPLQPCTNLITEGDAVTDGTGAFPNAPFVLRLTAPLLAGETYALLTTTDAAGQTGTYEWRIFAGPGTVDGAPVLADTVLVNLRCGDENRIFQQAESLDFTGTPQIADNCSAPQLDFDDELDTVGDCGQRRILRRFSATDPAGNTANCAQVIRIPRLRASDIQLPPAAVFLTCTDTFESDAQGMPLPSATGFPAVLTLEGLLPLGASLCNLSASYSDFPRIPVCAGSYRFVRQWALVDACDPGTSFTYQQQIFVGDVLGPIVSCTLPLDSVPTDKDRCTASFAVPLPRVEDACSDWQVKTEIVTDTFRLGPGGDTLAETAVLATLPPGSPDRRVSGIPEGCHRIRYTVTDDCGNQSLRECAFCVVDDKAPTATCNEFLQVTLDGDGRATLNALDADEGSWDNCGLADLQVRRAFRKDTLDCTSVPEFFGPFAAEAIFSCCDRADTVQVELLAVDAAGNENVCRTEVLVEDKVRPQCLAPKPDTVSCLELADNFDFADTSLVNARFGRALALDNCAAEIEELPALDDRNQCGVGIVTRRFRALDKSGNYSPASCTQRIAVRDVIDYDIRFPADETGVCGFSQPDSVQIRAAGCGLLAVSVQRDTLIVFDDECVKVERRIRVLDWCRYDGVSNPVVVGRDEDGDSEPGNHPVWVLQRSDRALTDGDPDETNGFFREVASRGFWEYTQLIKIVDTVPPNLHAVVSEPFCILDQETCLAEVDIFFTTVEDCTPSFIEVEAFVDAGSNGLIDTILGDDNILGRAPKFRFNAEFPEGLYELILVLRDGCGNPATFQLPFEVIDCKAPAPACINGWAVELMPLDEPADVNGDGITDFFANTVPASLFIPSPPEDCNEPVTYSIHRRGDPPHPDSTSLTVTCADLGRLDVEVYAWDSAFNPEAQQPDGSLGGPNFAFCRTFLEVQSNLFPCDQPAPFLGGLIATEIASPVQDVQVQLSGLAPQTAFTNGEGIYRLDNLSLGEDYTIFPSLDRDYLNGVSTLDLVLIQRHILGIDPLNSPYKRIAADVNGSATISTIDLVIIRRLILGVDETIAGNTSWRFVDAAYQFPDPDDPWSPPFPELININDLAGSDNQLDFTAVKVGDVNNSAQTNGIGLQLRREAEAAPLELVLPEVFFKPGQQLHLPIRLPLAAAWQGGQFTLRFDPEILEYDALEPAVAGKANVGAAQSREGILTCSWDRYSSRKTNNGKLLTLKFRAHQGGRLSEVLRLGTAPLHAEVYDARLQVHPLLLTFTGNASRLQLDKPRPNPFRDQTVLDIYLLPDEPAVLRLRDSYGRLLREYQLPPGRENPRRFTLRADMLPAAGVYFAELLQGKARAVQKLVRL